MPEHTVQIPCGVAKGETLIKSVTIQGMTGRVRKELASPAVRKSASKVITTLLHRCIVSIEGIPVNQPVIRNMYAADRDTLAMEIRKISPDKYVNVRMDCPKCGEHLEVKIDLEEDVPFTKLEDLDAIFDETHGYIVEVPIKAKGDGFTAVFRLPRGTDQENVAAVLRKNPIEGMQSLMSNCVVRWGEEEKDMLMPDFLEDEQVDVLDEFTDKFTECLPGPSFNIPSECPACDGEIRLDLQSSDFFFHLPQTERT